MPLLRLKILARVVDANVAKNNLKKKQNKNKTLVFFPQHPRHSSAIAVFQFADEDDI